MRYEAFDKSGIITVETVKFNFSTTLSEQYAIFSRVAKKVENIYKKSEDESLNKLAKAYNVMKKEAKYLSNLVKLQFPEYNQQILQSTAILTDPPVSCAACHIIFSLYLLLGCLGACFAYILACICVCIVDFWELIGLGLEIFCEFVGACP